MLKEAFKLQNAEYEEKNIYQLKWADKTKMLRNDEIQIVELGHNGLLWPEMGLEQEDKSGACNTDIFSYRKWRDNGCYIMKFF